MNKLFVFVCTGIITLTSCKTGKKPLAEIINLPDFSEKQAAFTLAETTDVQVYAVGELLFNICDEEKKYYLKSDDIDVYVTTPPDSDTMAGRTQSFNFSMANDETALKQQGIITKWIKPNDHYACEIRIPWRSLNMASPQKEQVIPFDICVGDNDNGFFQSTRLKWSGSLVPGTKQQPKDREYVIPQFAPLNDSIIDKRWDALPCKLIENKIYGTIKDSLDLGAYFRAAWDNEFLYLLVYVTDEKLRRLFHNRLSEYKIFVDYGWLENEKGEVIWEMLAQNSREAGGSCKNQKIDTVLRLPAGTYTVKYVTDESHSSHNWNAEPPKTQFYGIKVFKYKAD